MKILIKPIRVEELKKIAKIKFGNFVKAVVDIEKEIMIVGGELHSDEESQLLKQGSKQQNLWGINLYPDLTGDDFIEYDSMINVRPNMDNLSRNVENKKVRDRIAKIINSLITK